MWLQFCFIVDSLKIDGIGGTVRRRSEWIVFKHEWWGVGESDYAAKQMEPVDETEAKPWEIDWLHYAIASDGLETPAITLPSENASSLDGELLFQAAKYTLRRNKDYEFISNVYPTEGRWILCHTFELITKWTKEIPFWTLELCKRFIFRMGTFFYNLQKVMQMFKWNSMFTCSLY